MRKYIVIILLLLVVGLSSFQEKVGIRKIIHFDNGLELIGEDGENYGNFTTYTRLILRIQNRNILIKLKESEFELDGKHYPFYRRLKNGSLEFLITINDRPFKYKLLHLIVKGDTIIKREIFPFFEDQLTNCDNDKELEYKGFLDYPESFCNQCDSMDYNPTLYYEFRETGIILDSLTTIRENKNKYGAFYGFKSNDSLRFKINKKE